MKRIVILISGRGSNLEAIVQRSRDESWPAQIVAVIANKADAGGLAWAALRGIATAVVAHCDFASRDDFDAELSRVIDGYFPDLVVLAGFMRVLGASFVQRFEGRLLNIHPSLLPAFAGLNTHRQAIASGCKLAGATVHFVTTELDHGPIVIQAAVPVLADDTETTLAARVLLSEHQIYPLALRWFVEGRLSMAGGRVTQLDGEPQWLFAANLN
jgi:phosphoribosylglycinamide formyltransferase-1